MEEKDNVQLLKEGGALLWCKGDLKYSVGLDYLARKNSCVRQKLLFQNASNDILLNHSNVCLNNHRLLFHSHLVHLHPPHSWQMGQLHLVPYQLMPVVPVFVQKLLQLLSSNSPILHVAYLCVLGPIET